jgi:immunity protein 70 of polymorphic toxin system
MGLYLCVFSSDDRDDDLDGIEVGSYDDFGTFRDEVHGRLEAGENWGALFPTLLEHSDCDGEWTVDECRTLGDELATIRWAFAAMDPPAYSGWQAEAAEHAGHRPANFAEYFIDIDGEILLDRMSDLAQLAIEAGRPITFM